MWNQINEQIQRHSVMEQEQEHQRRLRQTVEERGQLFENKQEREKAQDYYQWGTTDFYQQVLTPVSCVQIEEELKAGPPSQLSKSQKKAWRAQRENLHSAALKRETFFRISNDIADRADTGLQKVKQPQIGDCYGVLKTLNQETRLDTEALLREPRQVSREGKEQSGQAIQALKQLMTELGRVSLEQTTPVCMAKLIKEYTDIENTVNGVSAIRRARLEAVETLGDVRAGCIFLYYGTATLLMYCLEQLPVNMVNTEEFAKLRGLATAYGMVASRLELSSEYQTGVESRRELKRKKLIEEGQKQQEMEEKIQKLLVLQDELVEKQPLTDGTKLALKEALVKRLKKDSVSLETAASTLLEAARLCVEEFMKNHSAVEQELKKKLVEMLGFSDNGHRKVLLEKISTRNTSLLLDELTGIQIGQLVEQEMSNNVDELTVFGSRVKALSKLPNLGRIPSDILLKMDRIVSMILDQDGFEGAVRQLEEQVAYTLTLVDDFLEEKLSPLSRRKVFERLAELDGVTMVFGTFTEIWNMVEHYMNTVILKEDRDVIATEAAVLQAMEEARLTGVWKKYVFRNLSEEDPVSEIPKKLKALEETIQGNLKIYNSTMAGYEFTVEKWARVEAWKEDALDKTSQEFREQMKAEIDDQDLAWGYIISLEEYLEEQSKEAKEIDRVSNYSNQGLLKWDLLCSWDGFEGQLAGMEEDVMEELDKLLKQGSLKAEFPFLEEVGNLKDLEALTFTELQILARQLRVNLSRGIRGWYPLVGVVDEDVRLAMLSEMLLGKLDQDKAGERANELRKEQSERNRVSQFRIRHAVRSALEEGAGTLRYRHIDETTARGLFERKSRVGNRMSRFQTANRVWELLKTYGMDQDAIRLIREKGTQSGSGMQIHMAVKTMMLKIIRQPHISMEAGKFCEKFETDAIHADDYVNEFRLCGVEGFLLDEKNDPEAYRIFTSVEHNQGYKDMLREKGAWVSRRMMELNDVIREANLNGRFSREGEALIRLQMRPFLAGLRPGKEAENLRRFGVRSWDEALAVLKDDIALRSGFPRGLHGVFEMCYIQYEKQLQSRRPLLEEYRGGVLKPIIPLLMQDNDFWQSVLADRNKPFMEKLDGVYQKLETPLTLLSTRYSYGEEFVRQLVEKLGEEFLYGKERSKEEWQTLFDDYFTRYCDHEVAGYSVSEELKKLEKKDSVMAGYMMELLLTHPKGLELIRDKNQFRKTLDLCKANVEPNTKAVDAFVKNQKREQLPWTEGDDTGFRMFVRSHVLTMDTQVFPTRLSQWLEEFEDLKRKTLEQAAAARAMMEERASLAMEFEIKRNEGLQMDREDRESIRKLRKVMRAPGSPLLAALGVQKMPGAKELQRAKRKASAYRDLPEAVQNCLFEAILAGRKEEELTADARWLTEAEALIQKNRFPGGEGLTASGMGELLTFLYIRRQKQIIKGAVLTAEELMETFGKLGARREKLSELMNKDVSLVLQGLEAEDIRTGLRDNPALVTWRRMVTEAMSVALFTVQDDGQFDAMVTHQSRYLVNAQAADRLFRQLIEQHVPAGEGEKELLKLGLAEYFHSDLLRGTPMKTVREQALELLRDEAHRKVLVSGAAMGHLLAEGGTGGKALMDGVGSTSLTDGERELHTIATRETLEKFLSEKHNDGFRAVYNELDREQRQVFALAVLQTEYNWELPSMRFIRSSNLEETRRMYTESRLENYAEGRQFNPEIAYDRVMEVLRRYDGRMNADVFKRAMEITQSCIRSRREKLPGDLTRLSDARNSIRAAAAYVKHPIGTVREVTSLTDMKTTILAYDEKAKGRTAEIRDRFSRMNQYMLPLLVAVLQDRTVMDHTTRAKSGGGQEFVNTKERECVKQMLYRGRGPRIITRTMNQALTTLMSYQLRDDMELVTKRLKQEDFAPKALTRGTQLDWALLERAMDFVDEILEMKRVGTDS